MLHMKKQEKPRMNFNTTNFHSSKINFAGHNRISTIFANSKD